MGAVVPPGLAKVVIRRKDGRLQTLEEAVKEQEKVRSLASDTKPNDIKREIEEMLKDPKAIQDACYQFLMEHRDVKIAVIGLGDVSVELLAQHVKDGTPIGLILIESYRKLLEHTLRVIG